MVLRLTPSAFAFLSTLPVRGATKGLPSSPVRSGISIHAPREGSDLMSHLTASVLPYFYPRSP